MKKPTCKIEGCEAAWPGHKGYCSKHYQRLRKYGDPNKVRPKGWVPGDPSNPSLDMVRRARLSARRRASITPPETRAKISASMKRRLEDPIIYAKWCRSGVNRRHTEESKKKMREAKAKLPKKLSALIHKADSLFSKYIRHSYADGRGNIACFTCDNVKQISEMDCGHFVGRQHKSVRWDERNGHPQCRYCNRYNEGRKDVYAVKLMEKYGPNILLELQEKKQQIVHLTHEEMEKVIDTYKRKLEALEAM